MLFIKEYKRERFLEALFLCFCLSFGSSHLSHDHVGGFLQQRCYRNRGMEQGIASNIRLLLTFATSSGSETTLYPGLAPTFKFLSTLITMKTSPAGATAFPPCSYFWYKSNTVPLMSCQLAEATIYSKERSLWKICIST